MLSCIKLHSGCHIGVGMLVYMIKYRFILVKLEECPISSVLRFYSFNPYVPLYPRP